MARIIGLRALLLAVLALAFTTPTFATIISIPTDDELIVGARAIVRGRVLSVGAQLDEPSGRIFTYVSVRVQEVLKGQINEREIVLKEEGGEVGFKGSMIFGTPQFTSGERVLLYLDTWGDGSLRVQELFAGKFSIVDDPATGKRLVVRQAPGQNTLVIEDGVTAASQPGGAQITNRMELSAYTAMLRGRIAANSNQSLRFETAYYRGIALLSRPPEFSNATRRGLQPQFTFYSNGQPPRWFEPDTGQPVVFTVNPDGAPSQQAIDDCSAAMAAWSGVPGCTLRVVNGGPSTECGRADQNTIVFNNCDSRFAPTPGCASVIALGSITWDRSITKVVNGTTFYKATNGHISFNPYSSCDFGDHCKLREFTTHELGHALGLGHSEYPDATMYAYAHLDGRCASIKADDMAAVVFLYPAQDTAGGPLAVTTTSLHMGVLSAAYTPQVIAATGGAHPYTWLIVPGLGRLPDGMTLSASGVLAGIPTQSGTSTFTARVGDGQGNQVDKALSVTVVNRSPGYDSIFVSQTVPATLAPSQVFSVDVVWLNNGTNVWDGTGGFKVKSQNPSNNTTWGGDTVLISAPIVSSGQQLDATFTATAPRNSGAYNFQWQLYQDGIGLIGQLSANINVTVTDGTTAPSINAPATLDAVRGTAFSYQLAVTGGSGPFSWIVVSGAPPAGLSLNSSTGQLSGTPTAAGSFPFTVQLSDSQSRVAQKNLTINVALPTFEVSTTSIPSAQNGVPFSYQLAANGGKPPYTWALTQGALPAGMSLAASTGLFSGTPTVTGNFGFTVGVTDSESRTANRALSITVAAPPLSVQASSSLEAVKGSAFSYQPVAAGGSPPYTWSITSGALPGGLSISAGTGVITGTPTAAGTFAFTVGARDQASAAANALVQLRVLDPETIPAITRAKYKGGKKLIVTGDRINPAAVVQVDGNPQIASPSDGQFVVKHLTLAAGQHQIRIVNPGNIASQPYILNVN